MRRLLPLLLVLAVASCSGSSARPAENTRGQQLVALGALTVKDLPAGFTAKDAPADATVATCLGLSTKDVLAAPSRTFTRGQVAITSLSALTNAAAAVVPAYTGSKASGCLQAGVVQELEPTGLSVQAFTAAPLPTGQPDAYGYTVTVSAATSGGFPVSFTDYVLGAVVGGVQVSLTVRTSSDTAWTAPQAVALLRTVTERVRAAG